MVEKLSARYSVDGPDVLHGLNFGCESGEKVGIGEQADYQDRVDCDSFPNSWQNWLGEELTCAIVRIPFFVGFRVTPDAI